MRGRTGMPDTKRMGPLTRLWFRLYGPAQVSAYDPTPPPPSDARCDTCGQRWTDHTMVRAERSTRAVCPPAAAAE